MIHFRIRDYASVLLYRMLAPAFGAFGRGVRIVWPLRIVGSRHVELGDRVTLHNGSYVAVLNEATDKPLFRVGSGTMIGNHAHIIATRRIEIGTEVLIADRVYIADNRHGYEDPDLPVMRQALHQLADVHIGDGTWIGENACVIGCRIGRHCVVGANSVVIRDVPDFCLVAGVPATIIKRFCERTGRWRRTDAMGTFRDAGEPA